MERFAVIQFCQSLLESLELYCEVAHELCLPYDLHTASDLMTTVVNILESRCD